MLDGHLKAAATIAQAHRERQHRPGADSHAIYLEEIFANMCVAEVTSAMDLP